MIRFHVLHDSLRQQKLPEGSLFFSTPVARRHPAPVDVLPDDHSRLRWHRGLNSERTARCRHLLVYGDGTAMSQASGCGCSHTPPVLCWRQGRSLCRQAHRRHLALRHRSRRTRPAFWAPFAAPDASQLPTACLAARQQLSPPEVPSESPTRHEVPQLVSQPQRAPVLARGCCPYTNLPIAASCTQAVLHLSARR